MTDDQALSRLVTTTPSARATSGARTASATRTASAGWGALAGVAGLWVASCSNYRPARFVDAPPVADVLDDQPVPRPRNEGVPEPVYISEVYLHRPIRDAMRASPFPSARDVNAWDEVPRSSWYSPRDIDGRTMATGPSGSIPPEPPFVVLADHTATVDGGISVIDLHGVRYELGVDRASRPEMRTAAAVIGARIGWALGYTTPPSCIAQVRLSDFVVGELARRADGSVVDVEARLWEGPPPVAGAFRVSAVRWSEDADLGSTPIESRRRGDPNDRVAHRDRRTLRALQVVGAWLRVDIAPTRTRDIYEGSDPQGHLVHALVGWDDSLGAGSVVEQTDLERPRSEDGGGSPFFNLVTFGLVPPPRPSPTQTRWTALGDFEDDADAPYAKPSLPYEPIDRLQAVDGYWMAKRIARLSPVTLAAAVEAGRIGDVGARDHLLRTLLARRQTIVRHWLARVTPLEVEAVRAHEIVLRDEALHQGYERSENTGYVVEYMNGAGRLVGRRITMRRPPERFRLILPDDALEQASDYLVARITATRDGVLVPRAFEVHLRRTGEQLRVVGVRH